MTLPTHFASRILILSLLFFAIIITSIFQGLTITTLTRNRNNATIKTMNDLHANNFRILIHFDAKEVVATLGEDWNAIAADPKAIVDGSNTGFMVLRNESKIAFLNSKLMTDLYMKFYFDNKTFENLFEVIPEVAFEFYVSAIIPKTSPFIKQFRDFMKRYSEHGLRKYQALRAEYDNEKQMIRRLIKGMIPEGRKVILELSDLWTIFEFYLVLNGLSLIALTAEVVWKSISFRRNSSNKTVNLMDVR